MDNIALVLLAAGASTRMGSPKQLLPYEGRPLIRHAAEVALASKCEPVVIVLGSHVEEIRAALGDLDVVVVENTEWQTGMGSSIRAGISGAEILGCAGAILALADQPRVTAEIYNHLIAEHDETGRPIIASEYSETVGVPVLFARAFFPDLKSLPANQGCNGVILAHLEQSILVACPEAELDLDTPDDYEKTKPVN